MTSQYVHLFRSINALVKRLPKSGGQNTYLYVLEERMKLNSELWLGKLSQCAIFLRQHLVGCPGLLRNVDLCMNYLSFLLQNSNGVSGIDTMVFTAAKFLVMQVEQCDKTVPGDYGFALLVQEIIILQTLSQDNTSSLPFQLWEYLKNYRNLRQLCDETDILPPIHKLLLLTRSDKIIQAASDSGLLPHVVNERDLLGRRFLELILDEVPNPNLQCLPGFYTAPNEETDIFKRTSLHVACMNGCEDIVQWFLGTGVDPNARGLMGARPLHIAILYGYESLAFSLIRCGKVDISCTDDFGMTCLQYAQWGNFYSLARHLRLQADSQRRNFSYYDSFEFSG
jgi:hypothetical protein